MARVIAFYVPANFRPGKPREKGPFKLVAFDSNAVRTTKNSGFWVALEKMFPERHPQTHG